MRRSPEKLIARLRNRKIRTIGSGVLTLVFSAMLAVNWSLLALFSSSMAIKEGEDPVLHLVIWQPMVLGISTLVGTSLFLASLVGFFAGMLLNHVTGCTKDDLLVQLWDRVEILERSGRSKPEMPNP
jgi:hypothetical protein